MNIFLQCIFLFIIRPCLLNVICDDLKSCHMNFQSFRNFYYLDHPPVVLLFDVLIRKLVLLSALTSLKDQLVISELSPVTKPNSNNFFFKLQWICNGCNFRCCWFRLLGELDFKGILHWHLNWCSFLSFTTLNIQIKNCFVKLYSYGMNIFTIYLLTVLVPSCLG